MSANLEWRSARVLRVIDGDTTELLDLKSRVVFKARHIGYNSPETKHPARGVECYGPEASAALKNLIDGKIVAYALDPLSEKKDKYNRDLVHLRFDGEILGLYMIRRGLAFAYRRFQNSYKEELLQTEAAAKAANIGLWGACQVFPNPEHPEEWLTQPMGK